jgi:phosphotransferase system HPr (HPr) family protein
MCKIEVILNNKTGLHARPASMLVKEASKYKSKIALLKDQVEYDAKSIISVLKMGATEGDKITFLFNGDDEKEALQGIKELLKKIVMDENKTILCI